MAPVGRAAESPKGAFVKGVGTIECASKKTKEADGQLDSEVKEEPADLTIFNEETHIKLEEVDEELETFKAMKDDEGFMIRRNSVAFDEETGGEEEEEEDQKPDIDVLNEVIYKPEKGEEREALLCKVCGKQFTRVFYFNQHIKTHKFSVPNNHLPEKPHKCQECGKTFALLQHLAGHSRTHIAGKYYECPVCRRKFTELSNITMHLLKTHPDEKPYRCSECDKQFTQSSALKKHLRSHSLISQEDLDRIDTVFLIDDGTGKDTDEPPKKKIKLEEEEHKSPLKEKMLLSDDKVSPVKEEKNLPLKEKHISSKENSPSKEKSLPVKEMFAPSQGISLSPKAIQSKEKPEPVKEAPLEKHKESSLQSGVIHIIPVSPTKEEDTIPNLKTSSLDETSTSDCEVASLVVQDSPMPAKVETSSDKEFLNTPKSSPKNVSIPSSYELTKSCSQEPPAIIKQILTDSADHTSSSKDLLHQSKQLSSPVSPQKIKEIATSVEDNPMHIEVRSEEGCPSEAKGAAPLRDTLPSRNGVPLDQVKNPLIKITKYAKLPEENDPPSSKSFGASPLKSASGSNVANNFESQENKQQILNSSQAINGDKSAAGKTSPFVSLDKNKSQKRESFPSLEKPGKDYDVVFKCHRCEIFLDSEEKLHDHLMDHTGIKLCECRFCGKDFTKMNSLKKHLYYHVAGVIAQDCTRCNKTFPSFRELKEHSAVNKCTPPAGGKFKCFRCRKFTSSLRRLKVHLLSQCNEEPVKYYVPKTHVVKGGKEDESMSKSGGTVKDCSAQNQDSIESVKLASQNDWISQKFEKTDVQFEEDEKSMCSLTCSECDMKLVGVERMLLHIKEHILERSVLTCPVLKCGKLFRDPKEFKMHLKAHTGHKPYKCADCGKRFFLRENYELHASRHGTMKNWSSLNSILGVNGKQAKLTVNNPARSPTTIESTIANLEVSESDADRKSKCTPQYASQSTNGRAELLPLENRTEEKVFQEQKKFPRIAPVPTSRPIHSSIVSVSVTSQPSLVFGPPVSFSIPSPGSSKSGYSTASSNQSLSQKDGRLQYYRITESSRASISAANAELRKYPRSGRCEVCKKFCSRLDKHMMVHLNQKPHLCPVCPQAFRQSEHLRRHIRARHEGNHRQFECPQCHKRLTRKDKLKEHMKNCCRIVTSIPGSFIGDTLFDMIPESVVQSFTQTAH